MKDRILAFLKGFGSILLYFLLAFLGSLIFKKYYYSKNFLIATLSQLGTYSLLLLGFCLIYRKRLINDFKNFKKEYLKISFRNWLCGLCIMMISNIIISSFLKDIATNETLNRNLLTNYPISSIISMALIGPLVEELTFRASFKDAFKKWYTYALFTGLIFGLAHIASPNLSELLFIIPYGALGFFFAKSFAETDNIYTSFISHALHNSLCILLIFIM